MPTFLALLLVLVACGHPARPTPPPDPWDELTLADAAVSLYLYPDPIVRYAPRDRGAYVVRIAGDAPEAREVRATLGTTDDILGDDGFVVRLSAAQLDGLAGRAGVAGVSILQPTERRSLVIDRATELPEVRIDLFSDATAAELGAVGAWVSKRGGRVLWRGRTALRARVPREAIAEASRLSPVRWIE